MSDTLPIVQHALVARRKNRSPLTVEVQAHLSPTSVRCIAPGTPTAVRRGLEVEDTGAAVMVPVGDVTLGGVFDVMGTRLDGRPTPHDVERRSIHATAPEFIDEDLATRPSVREHKGVAIFAGVGERTREAFDLLTPLPRGGKAAASRTALRPTADRRTRRVHYRSAACAACVCPTPMSSAPSVDMCCSHR